MFETIMDDTNSITHSLTGLSNLFLEFNSINVSSLFTKSPYLVRICSFMYIHDITYNYCAYLRFLGFMYLYTR